jgi:phosphonate transport system substrate-binding protein
MYQPPAGAGAMGSNAAGAACPEPTHIFCLPNPQELSMISLSPSRTLRSLLTCALLALGAHAHAQQVFRVTTIPEEAATEQVRKFTPLATYLEAALGVKVEFTPVSDYPAAVESLVNKKVDLVWFGGFTHVQANLRSGGKIVPLAQREEDTRFQSVFIAKTDSGIKSLADMKGKQVSFGSQSSTSGHLMPRSFLLQAGINPERDFRRIAYSGAHDATIASVVSGKVDAAALDITVWRKFVSENRVDTQAVDVFYSTPPYFNYNWSVHADMPQAMQDRVKAALLALDPAKPEHAEILRLNRATRYIATTPENYKGLEAAARSAGLL